VVRTTVTAKLHNPSRVRRQEWQRTAQLYRDTKQFCNDGWCAGTLDESLTTAGIDNDLYAALQCQAIREAKSDFSKDGAVRYNASQPFGISNQNWDIDITENGTPVIGFPCISQWWYTPVAVHDGRTNAVNRIADGELKKTRLQVYRRGDEWFCSFTIKHDVNSSGANPIGVDIGERHLLAATAIDTGESMLVSGREAKYIRRAYRSLRGSLQEAGALRARNHVGNKEQRRITDLNHKLSRQLIDFAEQFGDPLIRMEDLKGIRENGVWSGVHSWHFHQIQQFITCKAKCAGIRVEKVDAYNTSKRCSACGSVGAREGDHFVCLECGRERHADLNASENIAQREGDPCTT
jgi:IS605 OrfB family transposase